MSEITIRLPRFIPVRPKIFDLRSAMSGSPRADILSGLTVALALVPEAIAFAFLAGVPPSSASTPPSSSALSPPSSAAARA